ncbi:MAG: TspO/MBR family protein [Patescibacteria group bacterium]|nr:TspO/MBR family protein [Patescibacteria group bacterium]
MSNIIKFFTSLLITLSAGGIGSIFTTPAIPTWYETLKKPKFNPPGWVFGPAWTILYILISISFHLIWSTVGFEKNKKVLVIFVIQLVLNALWSIIFFGLQNPALAFIEIVILWVAILLTLLNFYKLDRTAGLLLVPYLLWVTFAALLNFSIWQLN